jgi:acetyl-CoA carboxylase carboxyltransferase component
MINAMSNATVPTISIIIGSSFGAANFAMSGRGYYPRFLFSWPVAKCHVMGSEQLSGVLELLAFERLEKSKSSGKEGKKSKVSSSVDAQSIAETGSKKDVKGQDQDKNAEKKKAAALEKIAFMKAALKQKMNDEMEAIYCSKHVLDDGIIDPRETRRILGMCLSSICNVRIEQGFITGISRL